MLLIPVMVIGGSCIFHTITGEITINEPLTMTPDNFTIAGNPGDTKIIPCTLTNSDDSGWTVYFEVNSTVGDGVIITLPGGADNFTIGGSPSSTTIEEFDITIYFEAWCPPGNHTVTIDVSRGDPPA